MSNKVSIVLTVAILLSICGCTKESAKRCFPEKEMVMVFYGAGFNNLSSDIKRNIGIMKDGDLPFENSHHTLLTFTHLSKTDSDFANLTESHLVKLSKDFGVLKADTLLTIDKTRTASDPEVLREVMQKVADLYPNAHYGLVVSSHGTGWLPAGKYSNSQNFVQYSNKKRYSADLPIYHYNEDPELPRVKTFSAEVELRGSVKYSQETTIQSMAKAIPVHLDYLLFDACLMGCVEVAYEFRNVADKIAFSPAEVLVDGFDYSDLSSLLSDTPDLEAFCKRYFDYYENHASTRYATISVVRTEALDALASLCRELFARYRSGINGIGRRNAVQKYFRSGYDWFYDFVDILVTAGISRDDKEKLDAALDACISYKAATPTFITIQIDTYSGLSMYLPDSGDDDLNSFYKTLEWNKATNLVE